MKKIILAFAFATIGNVVFAQNNSNNDWSKGILAIENSTTVADVSKAMSSVDATNGWSGKYSAAYGNLQKAKLEMLKKSTANLDTYADEALRLINAAKSETNNNQVLSELYALESIAHTYKFIKSPKDRVAVEAPKSSEAVTKAESLDANNPRVLLAKAYRIYFLPDNFGGSKDKALAIFGEAKAKFTGNTVADMPSWGLADADFFISKRP